MPPPRFSGLRVLARLAWLGPLLWACGAGADMRAVPQAARGVPQAPATAPRITAATSAKTATAAVPRNARDVLDTIRGTGRAPEGYRGGTTYFNDGRGGGQVLPRRDAAGGAVTYREWDVLPWRRGVNRGADRLVTGSDGSAWYTQDHYRTFIRIAP